MWFNLSAVILYCMFSFLVNFIFLSLTFFTLYLILYYLWFGETNKMKWKKFLFPMWVMLTREFALCLFYKLSSSFVPLFTLFVHQSDARYLPLILESLKFGKSLSPDNIIFNIILFSDIKTTTTQCTTEKKFILFPVQN